MTKPASTKPSRRICVFCASSPGVGNKHLPGAAEAGRLIASRGYGLVYGGGHVGMMGAVADGALKAGGEVIGVIPRHLMAREEGYEGVTDLRVVGSMHERKALMAELSDGFVALPGGFGTLDELCEIITWAQLGLHAKPIGILNAGGYWDGFLRFVEHAVADGLIQERYRKLIRVEERPEALLAAMGF